MTDQELNKAAFVRHGVTLGNSISVAAAKHIRELEKQEAELQKNGMFQPSKEVLHEYGYHSFEVWMTAEAAAEDCECSINEIIHYKYCDIEQPTIVR